MKLNIKYHAAAFAVVIVLASCSRESDPAAGSAPSEISSAAKAAKEEVKEAAAATGKLMAAGKDEFVAATEKQLAALDSKVSDLAKKAEGYKDDAKVQADKTLAALREQREALGKKLGELKQASQETWANVKSGFADAMSSLEKAVTDAKSKFN